VSSVSWSRLRRLPSPQVASHNAHDDVHEHPTEWPDEISVEPNIPHPGSDPVEVSTEPRSEHPERFRHRRMSTRARRVATGAMARASR
jgi:hypothetical protein